MTIIPPFARPAAELLLTQMRAIQPKTEEQRRFIGTLNKALGNPSYNDIARATRSNTP